MKTLVWVVAMALLLTAPPGDAAVEVTSSGKAADLRANLNVLFSEHTLLVANTTAAALAGRDDELAAAAWALDANSLDLSRAIGAVYGKAAGDRFLVGWRKHIRFFLDYAKGVATKDRAKRGKAVADLSAYAKEIGAFLHAANPSLPQDAVAGLVCGHVAALTRAIDAQGAGAVMDAYKAMRAAGVHAHTIADPLAEAIVQQFPQKFR